MLQAWCVVICWEELFQCALSADDSINTATLSLQETKGKNNQTFVKIFRHFISEILFHLQDLDSIINDFIQNKCFSFKNE